jgi:hypothetical membrane protein
MLVVAGVVGPVIYAIVLFVLGVLEPGYDPIGQSMSELGAVDAQYAIVMNTLGFPLLGLFFMLFAVGVNRGISGGEGTRVGPFLMIISGVFLILTGVFPCDSGCIDVTVIGGLHSLFATLAALTMIPVPLAIVPRIYDDLTWRRYVWFSWMTTIITGLLSLLYVFETLESLTGLLQRLSMGLPLVWTEVTAIKILQNVPIE